MKLLRKKSMLLLIVMSFTILNAYSEEENSCSEDKSIPLGDGSESMDNCIFFTNQKMKETSDFKTIASLEWSGFIQKKYKCCVEKKQKGAPSPTGSPNALPPVDSSCNNQAVLQAQKCAAVAGILILNGRSWSNTEHTEAVTNRPAQQNQQGPGTTIAGSNIACTSAGIETIDYAPCKKFVDAYTAAEAATQMVHAGQSVMLQGKLMDVEADMIRDQNTATGALKAQAKGMKEQANIYAQRAALDASKLGVLYNLYSAIPQKKDLEKNCEEIENKKIVLGKDLNQADVKLTEDSCKIAISMNQSKFSLLQNQAALDAMKAQLMTAAVSTANNTILSKLTNDRAKEAKRAIADIEDFQPTDPFKIATEEEKTTLCEKDPSSSSCTDIGLDANYDAVSDNTIVFGSTGSGSSYTGGTASENEIANGSEGTSSGGSVPTIGSVIAEVDKSGSVESSAAGTVSSKANGGSASGGGGSGGGAGSLGGQTPQKAAEGGVAQAVASKVAGYSGGEGFSVTGGLGIKGKKSGEKSEENPFGKLFGKDGAKASDVNFRDIASTKVGAKGDNIFDMISKRYGAVNSEKRLVEYELAR